jgi:hypothetical protein
MAEYSSMKSYLEENNLHNFTFSPYPEKPVKAVTRHLPPRHASLENLGFNVINVMQMTATRRAPNAQTHAEFLPPFFVTLTRSKIAYEVLQLSKLLPRATPSMFVVGWRPTA